MYAMVCKLVNRYNVFVLINNSTIIYELLLLCFDVFAKVRVTVSHK